MKRVVITGVGALTPIGNTYNEYVENLKNGTSGAAPITRFDASLFRTKFACEVKGFKVEDFIHRREARRMDPFAQYAMITADQAIAHAGLNPEKLNLDRVGVIWGTGIGGFETIENDITEAVNRGIEKEPKYSPFLIPKLIGDIAPGLISIKYGFRGANYGTVSACASSTNSIGASFDNIRLGRACLLYTSPSPRD